jgi:hypothetical protein
MYAGLTLQDVRAEVTRDDLLPVLTRVDHLLERAHAEVRRITRVVHAPCHSPSAPRRAPPSRAARTAHEHARLVLEQREQAHSPERHEDGADSGFLRDAQERGELAADREHVRQELAQLLERPPRVDAPAWPEPERVGGAFACKVL